MTAARRTSQRPPPAATIATVAGGGGGRRKLTKLAITDKKRSKRTRSYHYGLRPMMRGCSRPCTDVQPLESKGKSAVKTAPAGKRQKTNTREKYGRKMVMAAGLPLPYSPEMVAATGRRRGDPRAGGMLEDEDLRGVSETQPVGSLVDRRHTRNRRKEAVCGGLLGSQTTR